jgi:hypothetical protein
MYIRFKSQLVIVYVRQVETNTLKAWTYEQALKGKYYQTWLIVLLPNNVRVNENSFWKCFRRNLNQLSTPVPLLSAPNLNLCIFQSFVAAINCFYPNHRLLCKFWNRLAFFQWSCQWVLESTKVAEIGLLYKEKHSQGCQIFLGTAYQNGKNIPKGPNIYQMAIEYTKWQ